MKPTYKGKLPFFKQDEKLDADVGNLFDMQLFSTISKKQYFQTKDVIYHEADAIDKVYFIRRGMVKLLSYLPNGRARIIRLHAKGDWLGLEGLVGQHYVHTALAVGEVQVSYRSLNSLQHLLHDNPRYHSHILKHVYEHLTQADRWIAEFSTGSIKSRVARLVEFLAKLEYGESLNVVELLSVSEMADMLGVTPESVSRILAEFKRNDTLHKLQSYAYEAYQIDSLQLQQEAQQ